jgi:hypothetical protein
MKLSERLRAVKWEETDDGDRMPDDPTHKCVFVDMRPNDFRALLREAADALEAAREDASTERRALLWLAGGDSGASSKAICHHMLGMKSDGSFPWDPSDLGRCLRLLELFPEWKPRIREMARYSPQWAALVARWDELAEMMADEVGIDWSKGRRAPRTYDAMKDAIDQARGKGGSREEVDGV